MWKEEKEVGILTKMHTLYTMNNLAYCIPESIGSFFNLAIFLKIELLKILAEFLWWPIYETHMHSTEWYCT